MFPCAVFTKKINLSYSTQSFVIQILQTNILPSKRCLLNKDNSQVIVSSYIVPSQMSQYGLSSFLLPWYWVPWSSSAPEDWVGQSSVSCWSKTSQISQNNRCFIPILAGSSSSDLQTTSTQSVNVLTTALRLIKDLILKYVFKNKMFIELCVCWFELITGAQPKAGTGHKCRRFLSFFQRYIRELKQTTTTTATRTSLNKRFNEQNNSCARAL